MCYCKTSLLLTLSEILFPPGRGRRPPGGAGGPPLGSRGPRRAGAGGHRGGRNPANQNANSIVDWLSIQTFTSHFLHKNIIQHYYITKNYCNLKNRRYTTFKPRARAWAANLVAPASRCTNDDVTKFDSDR
jgi:hypothetical protein